jgi:hypothetical protein
VTDQPVLLVVRPRRIAIYAGIASAVVLGTMVVIGLLLRGTSAGVQFRVSDQIGLIGVGVLMSAAIMTAARPRLRAFETGLGVRNVFGEKLFPWEGIVRVAFPDGSPWAQLILIDDDTYLVMAIQAMDRQRAVDALREVRALHAKYRPAVPPQPSPEALAARAESERDAYRRPLGRLEIIDQQKAAKKAKRSKDG